LFATGAATACSCVRQNDGLAWLEAKGFPPNTAIFHGKVERSITNKLAQVRVIEAFSGSRETKLLIARTFFTTCDLQSFPDGEAIFSVTPGPLSWIGYVDGFCSVSDANPQALDRLRAVAERANQLDITAQKARWEAESEATARAASANAQRRAARMTAAETILRANEGDNLFEPVTLGSIDPELARQLRSVQADKDFKNVHTVFANRLAIDGPVTVFEVDGKKFRLVRDRDELMYPWEGRTLAGGHAEIWREYGWMNGRIDVDGRHFEFRSVGDFGFVYETDPKVIADREENSRLPQEMAKARSAPQSAERGTSTRLAVSARAGAIETRSNAEQCEQLTQFEQTLRDWDSYRQSPRMRGFIAEMRANAASRRLELNCD
jgi:hypothetical protein